MLYPEYDAMNSDHVENLSIYYSADFLKAYYNG
jgi:hypothetical protein